MKLKLLLGLLALTGISLQIHAQRVNQFTGDFSYSLPLLSVPSPNGASIPVSVTYSAGIGVNQPASEVGLGWMLGAGGAVTRSVSGIPDDWKNITTFHVAKDDFRPHYGSIYTKEATDSTIKDFYYSTFKNDTPRFHFPDYDYYSVSAPGIGGSLKLNFYDYATVDMANGDHDYHTAASNYFTKKPRFIFSGDFSGYLDPRHYPTPISGSTAVKLPGDQTGGSSAPYAGDGFQGSYNRLITPNYVEYFTNTEINSGVTGFLDYTTGLTRTSADFDMDGIGAFRITDAGGNTYHFSQPVYINYTLHGMLPLENDYDTLNYDTLGITNHSSGSYRTKLYRMGDSVLVEYKQNARFAYMWLLTAVTGPDYVDVNSNKIPDESDKGYWIRYDWQAWCKNFISRSPHYGYAWSFTPNDPDSLDNAEKMITDPAKENGKWGSYSHNSSQVYYLSSIKSPTHTAAFVRDIRNDEHSQTYFYDDQKFAKVNLPVANWGTGTTQTDPIGYLYDNGGPNATYSLNVSSKIRIAPRNASSIKLYFRESIAIGSNPDFDTLFIYDGPDTTSALLGQYTYLNLPALDSPISSTNDTVTIKFKSDGNFNPATATGFKIEWQTVNPSYTVVPQLKLSKVILFENKDFAGTVRDSGRAFTSSSAWNLDSTTSSQKKLYNTEWYAAFRDTIDSIALRTVELTHDYLLSRKYPANIKTGVTKSLKVSPPGRVRDSLSVTGADYNSSGKLTLNKIVSYELERTQITPSHVFDYDTSSTLSNPDHNFLAIDNWGHYKIDISSKGFSSYVTDSSDAYTDAWCLRKITLPAGGTVEVEYESDDYEKVIKDSIGGGSRGPIRTYAIEALTAYGNNVQSGDTLGNTWKFTLEDDINDFWSLVNSPPPGTLRHVVIPYTTKDNNECFDNGEVYINYSSGNDTIYQAGGHNKIRNLRFLRSVKGENIYSAASVDGYFYPGIETCDSTDMVYTGNGYIAFQLPANSTGKVYGGGIRVKSITTKNGATDSYKTTYTYSGGVATAEADRFDRPVKKNDFGGTSVYQKLRAYNQDKHKMGPMVGYTTVTVKNTGQTASTPNGETIYTFATSDSGYDNFEVTNVFKTEATRGSIPPCAPEHDEDTVYLLEVRDKFSAYWGSPLTVTVKDINGNVISKTENTFTTPSLGTETEYFHFRTRIEGSGELCTWYFYRNTVSILRSYPLILSKQTRYEKGLKQTTEYFSHDSITGEATLIRSTDPATGATVAQSTPAFRVTAYQAMGPKSKDTTCKNILAATAEVKVQRDSSTALNDFVSYGITTWNDTLSIRTYNNETDKYENINSNGYYWRSKKSFSWTGPLGKYGIYRGDSLVAYNHSSSSNHSNWRPGSEATLVDKRGHVLESKGFNDRYAAEKYGYDWKFPVATASNSNYASFTHTSFEDTITENGTGYYGAEVKRENATHCKSNGTISAHTGSYMAKLSQNTTGPIYKVKYDAGGENKELQRGRTYRAAVSVHHSSVNAAELVLHLDGSTSVKDSMRRDDADTIRVGDWILLTAEVTVPSNYTSSGGTNNDLRIYVRNPSGSGGDAYFDDMRLQAVDAAVSATVYDEKTGRVMATLDNNNFATVYEYDEGGRVTKVYLDSEKGGRIKVKENKYNYARGTN